MKNLLITIACDYDYYELPCVYSVYLMIFFSRANSIDIQIYFYHTIDFNICIKEIFTLEMFSVS